MLWAALAGHRLAAHAISDRGLVHVRRRGWYILTATLAATATLGLQLMLLDAISLLTLIIGPPIAFACTLGLCLGFAQRVNAFGE